jgi:hypothetical protein
MNMMSLLHPDSEKNTQKDGGELICIFKELLQSNMFCELNIFIYVHESLDTVERHSYTKEVCQFSK